MNSIQVLILVPPPIHSLNVSHPRENLIMGRYSMNCVIRLNVYAKVTA